MKMFLSPAICLGGAAIGTATPLLTVDVTVPVTGGQVCTSTLPNLPVALLNPALTYVPGSTTLWACGRVPANWDIECFSLNLAAVNAWAPASLSTFDHPFSNFAFDNSLVPKLLSCPPLALDESAIFYYDNLSNAFSYESYIHKTCMHFSGA